MEAIEGGMTPDELRAMADAMERDDPGEDLTVEVAGVRVAVDRRQLDDLETLRGVRAIAAVDPDNSTSDDFFMVLDFVERLFGEDACSRIEAAIRADNDGFAPVGVYATAILAAFNQLRQLKN